MNKEVKGWTSSSKQQEAPQELTNTKEEICLEQTKRKVKTSALEWDDYVLQEQLKSFFLFLFFFFWAGVRDPISCSLLGGGITIPEQRL